MSYDSRPDTYEHIANVRGLMLGAIAQLLAQAHSHDFSKVDDEVEREVFDRVTPKLAKLTYGSDEYKAALGEMGEGLQRHYNQNPHHPEHWPEGIADMDLLYLVEMICDWIAATRRHEDGDIMRSIEQNAERFGYDDQMTGIFKRTAERLLASELPQ